MKKLPIGIENFEELRRDGCYYVDKTGMIEKLLQQTFKVQLITRPRRFGKTLMMSMLAEFFDCRKDTKNIFEDLEISEQKKLCAGWRNQWPVLFLTLKDVGGNDFDGAYGILQFVLSSLCIEHSYLEESEWVDPDDRESFLRLKGRSGDKTDVKSALCVIMRMMQAHYRKPVIVLIDEYDVPLAQASEKGYYEEMLDVIRGLLGMALKTNASLKFAVVTGCLRIAKESIFTGTNNFLSDTISGKQFDKYFGFTENEVSKLLEDTELVEHKAEMREWYDGYRFGSKEVYCPWDVLNHVNRLQNDPQAKPANYWKNTSHNGIIRSFIERTDLAVNQKFETLLSGGCVKEKICEDLTYDILHISEENLWSVLYLTGYLTQADTQETGSAGEMGQEAIALKIPNQEIRSIFTDTVEKWFADSVIAMDRRELFDAFWNGEEKKINEILSDLLFDTISYHDYKESYYHAFLAGIFSGAGYAVESNCEYGLGRPDLVVREGRKRRALIIEVKHSKKESEMESDCQKAMSQIDTKKYAREFLKGYRIVLCYGIAFFEKECLIRKCEGCFEK
ncbi:MAG: ATP-binding protein [Robinsoniella sp.]|nr:ATP-binding protein [Robinsoniella sp.]